MPFHYVVSHFLHIEKYLVATFDIALINGVVLHYAIELREPIELVRISSVLVSAQRFEKQQLVFAYQPICAAVDGARDVAWRLEGSHYNIATLIRSFCWVVHPLLHPYVLKIYQMTRFPTSKSVGAQNPTLVPLLWFLKFLLFHYSLFDAVELRIRITKVLANIIVHYIELDLMKNILFFLVPIMIAIFAILDGRELGNIHLSLRNYRFLLFCRACSILIDFTYIICHFLIILWL